MADYVTAALVKAAIPSLSGTTYDTLLGYLVTRASRMIDAFMGVEPSAFANLGDSATARYYDGYDTQYCYIDPCTSITTVSVKDSEVSSTYDDWTADTDYLKAAGSHDYPDWNAGYYTVLIITPSSGERFARGTKTVKVTAVWGVSASAPDIIVQAATIQTGRWLKRGQAGYQDVTASAELGQLTYAQSLDPDIKAMLTSYTGYRRLR